MNIKYHFFENENQLKEIKESLKRFSGVIPSWVQTLHVCRWTANDTGNNDFAAIKVRPKYLDATLNIYDSFYNNSEQEKDITLVHELLHIHFGRISTLVRSDMIEYIAEQNKDLSVFMDRTYRDLEEAFVEQFANFLLEQGRGSEWY